MLRNNVEFDLKTRLNEEGITQTKVAEMIGEKFSDLDLDIRPGNQPVYSFLIGVE